MNKSSGKLPFANLAKADPKQTDAIAENIMSKRDRSLTTPAQPSTPVPTPASPAKPKQQRHKKNRKRDANGRALCRQIYFETEVDDKLQEIQNEFSVNISDYVNKIVKEKLGL